MSFIRPEISEAVSRFRDAIVGIMMSILGMFWAVTAVGMLQIVGTTLAIAGAMMVFAGIQRGRFRTGGGGAGVVNVDEEQVTYFGPVEGGSIVISDLRRVELDKAARPAPEWVLHEDAKNPLRIPTNAEGADVLFDVFARLSGIDLQRLVEKLTAKGDQQVLIWQAGTPRLH